MSFTFGSQPAAGSPFGQTPGFGTQQPFGGTPTTVTPQFGSTFGVGTPSTGLQFTSPTSAPSLFGQTQPGVFTSTSNTFGAPGLFGTTSSAPSTGLTFGNTTSTAPSFGTGLTFGAPATSAPAFGAPASSAPSFGFSNTFANPASTQSTGLTFGTPATSLSTGLRFNTPASTGITFGTPSTAPTGISFGNVAASSAPTTGLTFGTPTTTISGFGTPTNTGLNFGATPASTGLTFSAVAPFNTASTASQSTGVTLGNRASAPTLGSGTTLNFTTPASTGIMFGTPATTGINLTTPAAVVAPASTSTTFSTSATIPSTGLSFGIPATTASLGFTAKTTGVTLGGTGTTSNAPTSLTFNTSFASASTANATTSTPFSALGSTTVTSGTTQPLGLGGIPTSKLSTAPTTAQQIGLGGISTTTPKQTVASSATPQSELPPKEQPLPNELIQTVEQFKAFLKEQKLHSSEIARFSMKELKTVEANIISVSNAINEMESELQKNKSVAEKLKMDTAQALRYADMAQRTFEIPAGMQYDNTAPLNFFVQLLHNFEQDLQQLRFHLEYISKQVKNTHVPATLTSEDLALGLRRLHQTFVTLAGRLQTVHNQVEVQKERYLTLRKEMLNDTSNIFESQNKELEALEYALKSIANENKLPDIITGPSPFNSLGTGQAQVLAQNQPQTYSSGVQLGQPTMGSFGASTIPLFGTGLGNTSSFFNSPTSNSFQLQKPPTGSKRGKT